MILKDEQYTKMLDMFNNLNKYIGKEIRVITYSKEKIQYYLTTLIEVKDFEYIKVKGALNSITKIKFFSSTYNIQEISFGGEILYRNLTNEQEKTFGITNNMLLLRNYYMNYTKDYKKKSLYYFQLAGLNLVKKELQKEWLCFVEAYYQVSSNDNLLNNIIKILEKINNRTSFELIYNTLLEETLYEIEYNILLDTISYFTDSGKFLKEYIENKSQRLNLTLQK